MKVVRTIAALLGALATLFVAYLGAVAAWIYGRQTARLARQRREAHRYPEWAAAHQLEYAERDDDRLAQLVGPVGAFSEFGESGAHLRVAHVFARATKPRAPAFLQMAMSPKPDAKPAFYITVAVARLSTHVPDTVIRPRTRGRSANTTLLGDVTFDAAFVVRTDDPAWVRSILGRDLIAWLLAFPEKDRPDIRLRGDQAVCSSEGPLLFQHGKQVFDGLLGFLDRAAPG